MGKRGGGGDEDIKKYGTFPKKATPIQPISDNKFQRMSAIHREQEASGHFQPKKIHFGGNPKLRFREDEGKSHERGVRKFPPKNGKFQKKEKTEEMNGEGKVKNLKGNKRTMKEKGKKGKNQKKQKSDPAKGTSTEYAQLANSDDSDGEVMDVSDMIKEEEESSDDDKDVQIPILNSAKKPKKIAQKPAEVSSKFSTKNKFNALGEDEEEEDQEEEELEPPSKKFKKGDSDGSDDDDDGGEEDPGDSEEEDSDEEERLKFREQISQMPLGKVREMKEKLGIKLFNKTYFGTSEAEKKRKETKKEEKRESDEKFGQHRPKEISSKRPVSSFRNIYGEHEKGAKKKRWDPRFDARAGDFKEVCFENNYQFLDEIRGGEMEDIRKEYNSARAEGDERNAARLKNTLQKMETREKTRAEKRRQAETRKELHDDNIERMLRGEAPIFRTKAQVRRIDAEKKFEELKKDNKLDKYMARKAKKESAKLKKSRPPFEGYGYQP